MYHKALLAQLQSVLPFLQHSKLRQQGMLGDNQQIFYNFDASNFITALNPMTRFVTYLGTVLYGISSIQSLVFISSPSFWKDNLQPGRAFLASKRELLMLRSEYMPLSSVPIQSRFEQTEEGSQYFSEFENMDNLCIKYIDTIGGHPEKRGEWFQRDGDIDTMRQKIRDACPFNKDLMTKLNRGEMEGVSYVNSDQRIVEGGNKQYKLVIYQRDKNRRVGNEAEILTALQSDRSLQKWNFQVVMHSTSRSPCQLSHVLNDADVLVTPHGFQSVLLIFLPRASMLFEIYPFRYYKPAYAPMSIEYGVMHGKVMSQPTRWDTSLILRHTETTTCFKYKWCRSYARNQDVILDRDRVQYLIKLINRDLLPRIDTEATLGENTQQEGQQGNANCLKRDLVYLARSSHILR